jgi:DNA ligase-1
MGFHKVDGVRASHLVGFFHGRSMDPFKNTALNAKFAGLEYAGFDGELTIDGLLTDETLDGETLCSLTTGLTNRSKIKKGEDALPDNAVWNLFDLLHPNTIELEYLQRYKMLKLMIECEPRRHVTVLPFVWINNPTEAREWITKCLYLNYEGAIFRDPKAMHKSGRATASKNDFWRYKPVSDKDAIVVSVYEAEANNNEKTTNSRGHTERSSHKENKVGKGTAGGFIGIDVETGKEIRTPCGCMKHGERQEVWDNRSEYAGRPYKYTSLDVGVLDQPRQGRWIAWRSKEDMTPADLVTVTKMLEGV